MARSSPELVKTILTRCCGAAIDAIKAAIRNRLFSSGPFGAPLKERTIRTKRKRGSSKPSMALYDTGEFYDQMKFSLHGKYALVYSDGKTEEEQRGFVLGRAKGHPQHGRNPFVPELPGAKAQGQTSTIGEVCKLIAGNEMYKYAKAEIAKATKGV